MAEAVLFSFNKGRSITRWEGFSLRWYVSDPNGSVLHDPALQHAVIQSLKLASLTVAVTLPLGVAFALALHARRGPRHLDPELPDDVLVRGTRADPRGVAVPARSERVPVHRARHDGAADRARGAGARISGGDRPREAAVPRVDLRGGRGRSWRLADAGARSRDAPAPRSVDLRERRDRVRVRPGRLRDREPALQGRLDADRRDGDLRCRSDGSRRRQRTRSGR